MVEIELPDATSIAAAHKEVIALRARLAAEEAAAAARISQQEASEAEARRQQKEAIRTLLSAAPSYVAYAFFVKTVAKGSQAEASREKFVQWAADNLDDQYALRDVVRVKRTITESDKRGASNDNNGNNNTNNAATAATGAPPAPITYTTTIPTAGSRMANAYPYPYYPSVEGACCLLPTGNVPTAKDVHGVPVASQGNPSRLPAGAAYMGFSDPRLWLDTEAWVGYTDVAKEIEASIMNLFNVLGLEYANSKGAVATACRAICAMGSCAHTNPSTLSSSLYYFRNCNHS